MEGQGEYTLASGNRYVGDMVDGEFHGRGTLFFPNGGRYEATWTNGVASDGVYFYQDGLRRDPAEASWDHCTGNDRRFYSEVTGGIPPAGASKITNDGSPASLPVGAFDCGNGYLDPTTNSVHDYVSHKLIRQPDEDEVELAKKVFRCGTK